MEFEDHVRAALQSLPAKLREAMKNVEIVVEDEIGKTQTSSASTTASRSPSAGPRATPVSCRTRSPSTGSRSRRSSATIPTVLEEEIRITVVHEIAHHFGVDEDRLSELGWG